MIRLIAIALVGLSIAGCRSVEPEAKRKMEAIQIPEIDFRRAEVADVIAFLVDSRREYDPVRDKHRIRLSLILDPTEQKREDAIYHRKYSRLKEYCDGKTITLNLRYCTLLNLLDFVTRYAGVEYEFKGEQIVIMAPDGEVLVKD
jgi:hypothetical protein